MDTTADTRKTIKATDLRPGDVVTRQWTANGRVADYRILRPAITRIEHAERLGITAVDDWGVPLFKFWARRLDTGQEGFLEYGPVDRVELADEQPPVVYLRIGSHRARAKLAQALGYRPRAYYSWKRAGSWAQVPAADADRLCQVTGVSRTRRTDDLQRCIDWSNDQRSHLA
jgi:hypothetical protein